VHTSSNLAPEESLGFEPPARGKGDFSCPLHEAGELLVYYYIHDFPKNDQNDLVPIHGEIAYNTFLNLAPREGVSVT